MPLQGHVLALAFSVLFNDLVSRRKAAIQKAMAVLVFTIESETHSKNLWHEYQNIKNVGIQAAAFF